MVACLLGGKEKRVSKKIDKFVYSIYVERKFCGESWCIYSWHGKFGIQPESNNLVWQIMHDSPNLANFFSCQVFSLHCSMYTMFYCIVLYVHVGRLGLGNDDNYCSVQEVMFPSGHSPATVYCGSDASIVITKAGRVLATGNNKYICVKF